MKKFYVTSQFVRDDENSIEVLVRKSHTAECPGDEWSTLVVFDYKDAAKVLSLLKEAGIPVNYISVQDEYTLRVYPADVTLTISEDGIVFGYYPQLRTLVLKEGEYIPRRRKNLER